MSASLQGGFSRKSVKHSRWLSWIRPLESPRLRLFCFPYAGGGASVYQKWAKDVVRGVEVIAIQPPGRETRIREPLMRDLPVVVTELRQALQPLIEVPCVFFGHSVGAVVAFELARELRRAGLSAGLRTLFVSGSAAPHKRRKEKSTYDLPREQFLVELRRLNGTPEEVLAHPELLDLVVPILRNDFFMSETYQYTEASPLDLPVVVFGGEADHEITNDQLVGWREQTTARPFLCALFSGDHFFIHSHREQLLVVLNGALRDILARESSVATAQPLEANA